MQVVTLALLNFLPSPTSIHYVTLSYDIPSPPHTTKSHSPPVCLHLTPSPLTAPPDHRSLTLAAHTSIIIVLLHNLRYATNTFSFGILPCLSEVHDSRCVEYESSHPKRRGHFSFSHLFFLFFLALFYPRIGQ